MPIDRTFIVACIAGLVASLATHAQTIQWLNPVSGNWTESSKWTGGIIPNSPGESAEIAVPGTFTVTMNASLTLDAVTLSNPSATLRLAPGVTNLTGAGMFNNGTVIAASSHDFRGTIVNGPTGLLRINSSSRLELNNPITNDGVIEINSSSATMTTALQAFTDIVIGGVGDIVLGGSTTRAAILGGPFRFGSGQTVRGFGQIPARAYIDGAVIADVPGQTLTLNGSLKSNNGRLAADGGTLLFDNTSVAQTDLGAIEANGSDVELQQVSITGGSLRSLALGVIRITASETKLQSVYIDASLDALGGSAIRLQERLTNDGVITLNPMNSDDATLVRVVFGVIVDGSGEIVLAGNDNRSSLFATSAGSHLTFGPGQRLSGIGRINTPLALHGTVAPGLPRGVLTIPSSARLMTWEPECALEVQIGSPISVDGIVGGSHTINGGTVHIELVDGYTPALFATHTIIDGAADAVVTGAFDLVTGPALPAPWVWKVRTLGNDVVVGASCPTDVNSDFAVDCLDFLDFIDDFSTCELQPAPCGSSVNTDYNGDTFVDILDFLDFIDAFASGC